jgi:hypothetical protein
VTNFSGPTQGDLRQGIKDITKAYCSISTTGTLEAFSLNVSSITDTGTGDRTIVWDRDFVDGGYTVTTSSRDATSNFYHHSNILVGSIQLEIIDADNTPTLQDLPTSTIANGNQ